MSHASYSGADIVTATLAGAVGPLGVSPSGGAQAAHFLAGGATPSFSGMDLTLSLRTQTHVPALAAAAAPVMWRSDTGGTRTVIVGDAKSDPERAFDQLVALKLTTADFAMHLDGAWRAGLFRQLDQLLDADEWDFSDAMPSQDSFRTFLRLILHNKVAKRPGLGATSDGKIIASWTTGTDRLTVECLPDDTIRWVVRKYVDGAAVSSANSSPVALLRTFLAPYQPELWFG